MIHHAPPITLAAARAYVKMWRRTFEMVPASVCLTLMEIESSFRPDAHAIPSLDAIARGAPPAGAWGLLQLLPTTAADMVSKLQRSAKGSAASGDIVDTLLLWDPQHPECLCNPALGSLLGVAYLEHLSMRFGPSIEKLAAAYHNGAGFLRDFLAAGKRIPGDLPPKGKAYVHRAIAVWPKYSRDDDPEPVAVA